MGKIRLEALVEPRILEVLGDRPVEKEHEELRQPTHPQVLYKVYRILSVVA